MYSVHVLPSFHYDVVYLKDYRNYLRQAFSVIDQALLMLCDCPEYTFTAEQIILLEEYCREQPEKLVLIKRFATEGRLHFAPGMYVMPDMNMPDGESMFLQIAEGFRWLEKNLHYRPEVCWIADCWGHHAQLPQILRQCGYKYYAFWRCMAPSLQRNHFIWQGLDGTQLKTHWLSKGYGSIRFPDETAVVNALDLELFGYSPAKVKKLCDDFEAIGARGTILLCNGGDFMPPQKSAPATVSALNETKLFKELSFSHPSRYFDALDWRDTYIYEGEFNSAFQGTFSSNIIIKQRVRECSLLFHSLERLEVLTKQTFHDRDKLLKSILKQQFHDTICGTIADDPLKDTIDELHASRKALLQTMRHFDSSDKKSRLFNPTQFDRSEILCSAGIMTEITVPAHSTVEPNTAHQLENNQNVLLPIRFSNSHYCAEIGPDGYITSLKAGQKEIINKKSPHPFGALTLQLDYGDLWLHFDSPLNGGCRESAFTHNDEDPLDRADAGGLANRSSFDPQIHDSSVVFSSPELLIVRQTGEVGFWRLKIKFTTEIRFRANSPRIDLKTEILPEGRHYRLRAAFPTSIGSDGETYYEIPFGLQKRNRALHAAQNWIDFSDTAHGLALLNKGLPANAVDEEGNILLTLFRSAAMEYKAPSAKSFQERKKQVLEYALMPHGKRVFSEIIQQGLLMNFPLALTSALARDLGVFVPSAPNVYVSGIRQIENGIFIRLYEGTGTYVQTSLRLPKNIGAYGLADGLGHPQGEFRAIDNGELKLIFKPFEIKEFLLK